MTRVKPCLLVLWAALAGCTGRQPADNTSQTVPQAETRLAPYQGELLDLAFGAASAIPVNPHISDRSTTQDTVVQTWLQLGQPERALRCVGQVENWRRGTGYADIAFYLVKHGAGKADVEPYLEQARQEAGKAEDWRKDRINVKIASTLAYLGQSREADQLATDVVPAETGKVPGVKAMVSDANGFEEQMKVLDGMVRPGNFDVVRNVLEIYGQMFGRFYADEQRRSRIEEKIKASWDKLPVFVRIDLILGMSRTASEHGDQAKAMELVDAAQGLMDVSEWPVEYRIPAAAKVAIARLLAGDKVKARADADALRSLFEAEGSKIVNVYRAGTIRPLAEAYQAMGDSAASLELYRRAVEAGVENPNSRPRAEDLAATCCSMALHGVQPDASLWSRIHTIQGGLGEPW
jgi:hypothetical protein